MARDVNRYESIVLDKMVTIRSLMRTCKDERQLDAYFDTIATLLDCIVDFREPPGGTPVEDGFGAMVDKEAK